MKQLLRPAAIVLLLIAASVSLAVLVVPRPELLRYQTTSRA